MEPTRNEQLQLWGTRVVIYFVLTSVALLLMFPLIYMVIASLKTTTDFNSNPRRLLPYTHVEEALQGQGVPLYDFTVNNESQVYLISQINEGENDQLQFTFLDATLNSSANSEDASVDAIDTDSAVILPVAYVDSEGDPVSIAGETITLDSTNRTVVMVDEQGISRTYRAYDVVVNEEALSTFLNSINTTVPLQAYLSLGVFGEEASDFTATPTDSDYEIVVGDDATVTLSEASTTNLDIFINRNDSQVALFALESFAVPAEVLAPLYEFEINGSPQEFTINTSTDDRVDFAYMSTQDALQEQLDTGEHTQVRRLADVTAIIPREYNTVTGDSVDIDEDILMLVRTDDRIVTAGNNGEKLEFIVFNVTIDDTQLETWLSGISNSVPLRAYIPGSLAGSNNTITVTYSGEIELFDATDDDRDYDVYTLTIGESEETLLVPYNAVIDSFISIDGSQQVYFGLERFIDRVEILEFQLVNYEDVLGLSNNSALRLDRALVNTAFVTILVTIGQITTSLFGGYAFSRIEFRGRDTLFLIYLGSIMVPFVVLIVPIYRLMTALGWEDHIVSLIVPWVFTAYGTFLIRQFFLSIPKEIEEAALLDGCSRFRILWRIFIPLSTPAIAAHAIFTFLYAWNSFLWPLIIINTGNKDDQVLTLALITLANINADKPNIVMTGAAVMILPPMIVFILAQRYFIEGIATSGLKG